DGKLNVVRRWLWSSVFDIIGCRMIVGMKHILYEPPAVFFCGLRNQALLRISVEQSEAIECSACHIIEFEVCCKIAGNRTGAETNCSIVGFLQHSWIQIEIRMVRITGWDRQIVDRTCCISFGEAL